MNSNLHTQISRWNIHVQNITAIFREYLYIGRDINHQIPYFGPNFTHFLRFKKQNQKFESNNSRFVGIEFQLPVLNQPLDIWSSVNSIFFWFDGRDMGPGSQSGCKRPLPPPP